MVVEAQAPASYETACLSVWPLELRVQRTDMEVAKSCVKRKLKMFVFTIHISKIQFNIRWVKYQISQRSLTP